MPQPFVHERAGSAADGGSVKVAGKILRECRRGIDPVVASGKAVHHLFRIGRPNVAGKNCNCSQSQNLAYGKSERFTFHRLFSKSVRLNRQDQQEAAVGWNYSTERPAKHALRAVLTVFLQIHQ